MKSIRVRMTRCLPALGLGVAAVLSSSSLQTAQSAPTTWNNGDVFVGVANGMYKVYDNNGVFKETINTGFPGTETTGGAFDSVFDLYTTTFQGSRVVKFDGDDPHPILQTINTTLNGACDNESVVFDAAGNFYVGNADCDGDIQKYDAAGNFVTDYNVAPDSRGSDWIDLAADQQTMFYTSEGRQIKRYNIVTSTQLANFAVIPGAGVVYAFRLLPPFDGTGGLIVADTLNIKRLNGVGAVIQTYDAAGEDFWFAMNLDPNGTSFWSANLTAHRFYRFNIASGAIELGPIDSLSTEIAGLIVRGEKSGGNLPPEFVEPSPCGQTLMASSGVPFSFTVTAMDANAGDTVTLTVSGLPAGATMTPALPAMGNPVSSTFNWTPANNQVGNFVIVFTATDNAGNETTCTVTITVAECHVILGQGGGNTPVVIFGHQYETQMHWVRSSYPVTMTDMPSFPMPVANSGVGQLRHLPMSVQVVMYNPEIFPGNPSQWTQRMEVTVRPDGRLNTQYFGTANGIQVRVEEFVNKEGQLRIRFPFTIDGM